MIKAGEVFQDRVQTQMWRKVNNLAWFHANARITRRVQRQIFDRIWRWNDLVEIQVWKTVGDHVLETPDD